MSAMFRALWNYRGFIIGSVKREFQSKYRNSLLGAAWAVLNPLAMIFDRHDDGSEARFDAALEAFCAKHGLPWREPRWLIGVDVS